MKRHFKLACFTVFLLFTFFPLFSQTGITYNGDKNYTLVERTDLRRYDNGKYSGLISREVRSFIARSEPPKNAGNSGGYFYNGNFFVTEQTVSAQKEVFHGIHDSIPSVFKIAPDGKLTMIVDNGYPSFRSFPAFPNSKLTAGASWQSSAVRAVDPLNKGIITRIPMEILYIFDGEQEYKGIPVYKISAKWATRYDARHIDLQGDKTLISAAGSHSANILVHRITGAAILIHDYVNESFTYSDGLVLQLKGSISQFTEYPPAVDHKDLIPALQRIAKFAPKANADSASGATASGVKTADTAAQNTERVHTDASSAPVTPAVQAAPAAPVVPVAAERVLPQAELVLADDLPQTAGNSVKDTTVASSPIAEKITPDDIPSSMVVEETPAGLRLSVRDIRFKADSAEILQDEVSRLDSIAEVLRLAPNSHFLIEGHSASVGNVSGEQQISEERARSIASLLSERGIPPEHFICRGYGSEKPVAPNNTPQGKAQNRRVEITILE